MKRVSIPLWILGLLALGPGVSPQEAQEDPDPGYKVVINAGNPESTAEQKRITDMFKKRPSGRRWGNGVAVAPVDHEDGPVREAFSRGVLGARMSAILSYWQRQIFSGRDSPPPKMTSDTDVLAYVKEHEGGIGYVAPSTELIEGVKELQVIYKSK